MAVSNVWVGKNFTNTKIAQKVARQTVDLYNNRRIHWSLGLKASETAHLQCN